jgi:hypothetical protein
MSNTTSSVQTDVDPEISLSIRAAFPSEEAKAKAAQELADSFQSSEFKNECQRDIQTLSQRVKTINRDLVAVRGDLRLFDERQFTDSQGNILVLLPEWDGYREVRNHVSLRAHCLLAY